jgi:hypothetical protein
MIHQREKCMRARLRWLELFVAAALAASSASCASQRPPSEDDRPTQIEGKVQSVKGSSLVVVGDDGATNVTIGKATSLIKAEAGTPADIAKGKWLEVQGKKAKDSSSILADLIRVSDGQPSDGWKKHAGLGGQQGPGGGPGGAPMGNMGGSPGGLGGSPGGKPRDEPPSEEVPGYRGTVESVDGTTIVIGISRGDRTTQVTLIVDSFTTITRITKASTDALLPGTRVKVSGDERKRNEILARSIEIGQ